MTTLYRAHYRTRSSIERHMTFSTNGGIHEAWKYAHAWQIEGPHGDSLISVSTVRPLDRPQFDLIPQEIPA